MITRFTESMKYGMINNSLSKMQNQAGVLMEKISTEKNINRPSDDPIGTHRVLDYRTAISSIEQYQTNITNADNWLKITETNLAGLGKVVNQAKNIAVGLSTPSASGEEMDTSAAQVEALISQTLSILNAKHGGNYIFGGSGTDSQPFSANYSAASIGTATTAENNTFNGTVVSGGAYSSLENKTYVVKIIDGSTPASLANASYQVSADGGKTWGTTQTDLSVPIAVGGGITLTFTAGTEAPAANDFFTVKGYIGGYYRGNNDELTTAIGQGNDITYNITGAEAFTAANGPVAVAAVVGAGLTADDTILLSRGAGAGSWTLTQHANYPDMVITAQDAATVTIDADNDGTNDITLALSGNWSEQNTASFTVATGAPPAVSAVTVKGPGTVDLLATLAALKDALASHDVNAISALVGDLEIAESQVLRYETMTGAKMSVLKLTGSNHDDVKLQITNTMSEIEDADMTELIVKYQMQQTALEASYNMAAQIGKLTILNYL